MVRTLSEGPGPVVRPGDYVLFDVAAKVWAGDRLVLDTFANHQPQGLPLPAGLPAWRHLAGQRVGSRVLEVVPPRDGFGRRGDASVNVTGTDTLVFVFDILAAVPTAGHASGTAAGYRPGTGLPQVTMSAHGPVVTVPPRMVPPKTLVTRMLIAGHGPRLVPGETVVTQFTGALWRTGAVFDSSWQHGDPQSFVLGSGQVIAGWNQRAGRAARRQPGAAGGPAQARLREGGQPAGDHGQGHPHLRGGHPRRHPRLTRDGGPPPAITGKDTLVFAADILAGHRRAGRRARCRRLTRSSSHFLSVCEELRE